MFTVARFGCVDGISILKLAGASVMPRDPDRMTPLHEASAATTPTFIAGGADPLARGKRAIWLHHRDNRADLTVARRENDQERGTHGPR